MWPSCLNRSKLLQKSFKRKIKLAANGQIDKRFIFLKIFTIGDCLRLPLGFINVHDNYFQTEIAWPFKAISIYGKNQKNSSSEPALINLAWSIGGSRSTKFIKMMIQG